MADSQQEYTFLKFSPALPGKATTAEHKGEIVIESLTSGLMQNGSWNEKASDAGRVTNFSDISFTKQCDESSPALYQACAMKTQFDEATISIKSGKDVVLKMILSKCIITSATMSYASGQDNPDESYSMSYRKIKWEKGSEKTGFDMEKGDKV